MKYILMCIAALLVCLGFGFLPARWIGRKKGLKGITTFLLAVVFSLILICGVTFGYLSVYYRADPSAADIPSAVRMEKIDGGYFFDGPGEDTALIFYPGAKVATEAYAPLLAALAEKGVDCFLADMPFRMAIFGSSLADKFLSTYSYDRWVAAGHSMGGLVISGYAASHSEIDTLILLGAYPGSTIPDDIRLCSVYGSQDGCLNREAYENAKAYWPASSCEFVLEGGNHAQYADYGPQSGDLEPEISRQEQQAQTVEIILDAVGKR